MLPLSFLVWKTMRKFTTIILFLLVFAGGISVGNAQTTEVRLLRNVQNNSTPFLRNSSVFLSNTTYAVVIGTPVILGTVSLFTKNDDMLKASIYMGATLVVNTVLVSALKYSINRQRPYEKYPELIFNHHIESSPSFPSGHTSYSFALATSLTLQYPKWYVIVPSYLWASSVAYSRMNLGVHYPTDILAGAVLGAGSAYLTHVLNNWFWEKQNNRKIFKSWEAF